MLYWQGCEGELYSAIHKSGVNTNLNTHSAHSINKIFILGNYSRKQEIHSSSLHFTSLLSFLHLCWLTLIFFSPLSMTLEVPFKRCYNQRLFHSMHDNCLTITYRITLFSTRESSLLLAMKSYQPNNQYKALRHVLGKPWQAHLFHVFTAW